MQGGSSRGAPARRSADAALVPEEVVSECLWLQVSSKYISNGCAGCVTSTWACQALQKKWLVRGEVGSADRLQQLNQQHTLHRSFGLANGPVMASQAVCG